MKEVELKVKNIDKKYIIKKIEELGAKKNFAGWVVDFRYDTPERDLSRQGKALRIRRKGKLVFLNLKGRKKSIENITGRDEIGVRISNFNIMQNMLNELGYIKIFDLRKYRTEYRLDNMTFDIDEYPGLSPILEIESDSYERVEEYVRKLGIEEKDIGRVYIREILAAKKKHERNKKKFQNNKKSQKENPSDDSSE